MDIELSFFTRSDRYLKPKKINFDIFSEDVSETCRQASFSNISNIWSKCNRILFGYKISSDTANVTY